MQDLNKAGYPTKQGYIHSREAKRLFFSLRPLRLEQGGQ